MHLDASLSFHRVFNGRRITNKLAFSRAECSLCGAMRRTLVSRRHIKDPGRVLLLAA